MVEISLCFPINGSLIRDTRLLHERAPLFAVAASREGVLSLLDELEIDAAGADFWNGFSVLQVL